MRTKRIDVSKIKPSPIRHEVLPEGFIKRVLNFKDTLKEVEASSLEETVSNFQRDLNPEYELVIWESIASCYKMKCENNPNWSVDDKKQAFKELLTGTLI